MELFHNQVTREQGVFSFRFNHRSFGLYFLAENVEAPTTVLDFPVLERFCRGAAPGLRLRRHQLHRPQLQEGAGMAEVVREVVAPEPNHPRRARREHPGHRAADRARSPLPRRRRRLPPATPRARPDRPIKHPLLYSSFDRRVMGVPLPTRSGVLIARRGLPEPLPFLRHCALLRRLPALPHDRARKIFEVCRAYEASSA